MLDEAVAILRYCLPDNIQAYFYLSNSNAPSHIASSQ
jgi:hypothetical protein